MKFTKQIKIITLSIAIVVASGLSAFFILNKADQKNNSTAQIQKESDQQ